METVLLAWSTPVTRSPSCTWEKKLKETNLDLKDWIKKSNNTPTSHQKETVQLLAYLQLEMENKEITTSEI